MNKILLILQREYLTRVRKKLFIISTILFPLLYFAFIFTLGNIAERTRSRLHVAVIDSSGYFDKGVFERSNLADSTVRFTLVNTSRDSIIKDYKKNGYDGFIVIPQQPEWQKGFNNLSFNTEKKYGEAIVANMKNKLNTIWADIRNEKLGIDADKKTIISTSQINLRQSDLKNKAANENIASTMGMVSGILIYVILLIYGSQVMMGVMEEKSSRVAEVIVSSVKPFQLMLGKILGIGLVALTQFFIWIAFIFIVYNVSRATGNVDDSTMTRMVGGIQSVITNINVPLVIFCFAFYFLGGFFFYSSLYAAIGSAVNEDMREAQSLSFPVTLLVIFSVGLMTIAGNDPSGPVAVWGSIIPISSPIVMMARIPYGVPGTVPWWQLGLSMALLVLGFIVTTWFAAKIYRTGILMYGKKPSWKEMMKWAFRRS